MHEDDEVRPEIATSWQRIAEAGLDPGAVVAPDGLEAIDPEGRLLRAAAPVLDEITTVLQGCGFAVVLGDADARLVDVRFGERSVRPALETLGVVPGKRFSEATTGTNSIATPYEIRRGIAVRGPEHYLEAFHRYACYGMPILDPLSRRFAGVLDITCLAEDDNPLLRPFLVRAAGDIEHRLLDGVTQAHRSVLAEFDVEARRSSGAVLAVGDDLVLTNGAASELLQSADLAALQTVAAELSRTRSPSRRCEVELAGGQRIRVDAARVEGGVVLRLHPVAGTRPPDAGGAARPAAGERVTGWADVVEPDVRDHVTADTSVLIRGESGTGRSTLAARLAGPGSRHLHGPTATAADLPGANPPARDVPGDPPAARETVVVTDAHLLAPAVAARLAELVRTRGHRLIAVVDTGADAPCAALVALCPVRLDLPSLRSRRDRIPAAAAALLGERTAGRARFTPGALRTLAGLDWPGNLRELGVVVDHVAARRSAGDVTEADLPPGYRCADRPITSGLLWQAERNAVVDALRSCDGNKVQAAALLGISRTTLYRRIRELRLTPTALGDG